MKKFRLVKLAVGFAAALLLLVMGGFSTLGAPAVQAQQTTPEVYPFAGDVYTGTNEVTGQVDDDYLVEWTTEGDLVHTEPITPVTHVFSIVIADGMHTITNTKNCVMYVDAAKDGGVWEAPDLIVELTGNTAFTITATNNLDAWVAVKCARPVPTEEPVEEFLLFLPSLRSGGPRE